VVPDPVGPEAIAALRRLAAAAPTGSASVAVAVLLAGGHRVDLSLARGHPLLGTLQATVVEHGLGRAHGGVIRLRLGDGAELAVAARDIVGVITDPPTRVNGSDLEAGSPGNRVIAADFRRYGEVLGPDDHRRLLGYVNRRARNFRPTGKDSAGFRRSLVLDHFPTFARLIEGRVRDHLDDLEDYFGVDRRNLGPVDTVLSAHGDGDFLAAHHDNGYPDGDLDRRELTFVYHFHASPQGFSGGELRLFDWQQVGGARVPAESYVDLAAVDNTLAIYPSATLHEVRPIRSPSGTFADRRFAISGFLRRKSRPR
jgi:SM-20-related protein